MKEKDESQVETLIFNQSVMKESIQKVTDDVDEVNIEVQDLKVVMKESI